jgi:hypothetical protein
MTRTTLTSGLLLSALLALGTFAVPVCADDNHRDYRGNEHRDDHRGNQSWNNGYHAPPVVYGTPNYYPPPVVYGSGIGINIQIP